jgi:hypothetical protein
MQMTPVFSSQACTSIEVFRTNVRGRRAGAVVLARLRARWPHWRFTLDLADCDRILRVQTGGEAVPVAAIKTELAKSGYLCEPLPDSDDDFPAPDSPCVPLNNSGK